jgi:hypothetical protein
MNGQQPSPTSTTNQKPLSYTRLRGRWLVLGRSTWITLVILSVGSFFASLPEHLARLQTLCAGASCSTRQLTPEQAELLSRVGWSLEGYAALLVALTLTTQGLSLLVSALIIWRRPNDRMALLVALMLATPGALTAQNTVTMGSPSPWQVPLQGLAALSLVFTVLVLSLFPSGRFVPRWTRWTLIVCLVGLVPYSFFRSISPLFRLGSLVFLGEAIILVAAQVYRYRRVSGPIERQQTKWVVVGITVPAAIWIGGQLLAELAPALADPTSPVGAPYQLVANNDIFLVLVSFPLAIGVAILRYRLWDIDTLINQALVYGLLTGVLAALYGGLILGLEQLAGLVSGQAGQPLVIVVSTLAIATLFMPLRRRLQTLIDRRFYRQKYDAAKSLAAFSATLRGEVDLEQVHARLLAVIEETMHPASLSLWIFPITPQTGAGQLHTGARSPAVTPSHTDRLDTR